MRPMFDSLRLIADAPRHNPLVRYGSPARRLSVPRALWWLVMGSTLFLALILALIDVGQQLAWQGDPYMVVVGMAMVLMPLLAGISFLGFGFPYRQRAHLDDLELAGLRPADLVVGFLFWPVVACGLVAGALMMVPWGTALASALSTQVSQSVGGFAQRVVASAALFLWTLLCLAVAARVWDRRAKAGWLVPFETMAKCSVHALWIVTALTGSVLDLPQLFFSLLGSMGGNVGWTLQVLVGMLGSFSSAWSTRTALVVVALAAVAFEGWRTWRASMRDRRDDDAPPTPPIAAAPAARVLPWWFQWPVVVPLAIVGYEALALWHHLAVINDPEIAKLAPGVWSGIAVYGALPLLVIGVVVAAIMVLSRGSGRTRWVSDDAPLRSLLGGRLGMVIALVVYVWGRAQASRWDDIVSGNVALIDSWWMFARPAASALGMVLLALFVAATLRPPGPRRAIAIGWLVVGAVIFLPPWGDLMGDATFPLFGRTPSFGLLAWRPFVGRYYLLHFVVAVFVAFGWRACAMWFEATKHRLVDEAPATSLQAVPR